MSGAKALQRDWSKVFGRATSRGWLNCPSAIKGQAALEAYLERTRSEACELVTIIDEGPRSGTLVDGAPTDWESMSSLLTEYNSGHAKVFPRDCSWTFGFEDSAFYVFILAEDLEGGAEGAPQRPWRM